MFGVVGGRFLKSWGDPAPEGDVAVSLGGGGRLGTAHCERRTGAKAWWGVRGWAPWGKHGLTLQDRGLVLAGRGLGGNAQRGRGCRAAGSRQPSQGIMKQPLGDSGSL